MKRTLTAILLFCTLLIVAQNAPIDRQAVLTRHNPVVTVTDSLGSLTVGNGRFAVTVDVTGLQSFPDFYRNGIPLTTMSEWGWHSFSNVSGLKPQESQRSLDLGHGHPEVYAVENKQAGRQKDATDYFRVNPHRLNLGTVGLTFRTRDGRTAAITDLQDIRQELSLWEGIIYSNYKVDGEPVGVTTWCSQKGDALVALVETKLLRAGQAAVELRLPYPTGLHADDAADYAALERHESRVVSRGAHSAVISHRLDSTTYYIKVQWEGLCTVDEVAPHRYVLTTSDDNLAFAVEFSSVEPAADDDFDSVAMLRDNGEAWIDYWKRGAFVDFGLCTDPRARELERRVVLSQYLTAVNCRGSVPPQETGLTYNSWFGRPHLEMAWWHLVHFSLWNRPEVLAEMLNWYNTVACPKAREIAQRQGFKGVRWMKMTDPWAGEAPSNTGSFLIWQQPHYIYLAEEAWRACPTAETLEKYASQVEQTAEFMADFARSCQSAGPILLFGATAMQESMSKNISFGHPFEQAYWAYGLRKAQEWRERAGLPRNADWDDILQRMSPLVVKEDRYASGLPVDDSTDSETFAQKSRSDHPAVLGACGMLPQMGLYNDSTMRATLAWVMDHWNWPTTWGWDYGMTAMAAARLGEPEMALQALLNDGVKNTYLPNGHNYQEPRRLRLYLPGNGSLLAAVAMMCAGWEGCETENPGFPHDGTWNVRWEGFRKMQ